jgi:hypothetical protein
LFTKVIPHIPKYLLDKLIGVFISPHDKTTTLRTYKTSNNFNWLGQIRGFKDS